MTADHLWLDQVGREPQPGNLIGPDGLPARCTCGHFWRAHVDSHAVDWADYVTGCSLMCCDCPKFVEHRPNP